MYSINISKFSSPTCTPAFTTLLIVSSSYAFKPTDCVSRVYIPLISSTSRLMQNLNVFRSFLLCQQYNCVNNISLPICISSSSNSSNPTCNYFHFCSECKHQRCSIFWFCEQLHVISRF